MAIEFVCVDCGQRYQVDERLAGRQLKCKKCASIVTIPSAEPVRAAGPSFGATRQATVTKPVMEDDAYSLDDVIDNAPASNPYSLERGYAAPRAQSSAKVFKQYELASIWHRFLANFLDNLIIALIIIGMLVVFLVVGLAAASATATPALFLIAILLAYLGIVVVPILYSATQESSPAQATYGKRALHLKVVNSEGDPISFGRSLGRSLSKNFLSGLFGIGFLIAFFNRDKQALHDMIAGTMVVYDR